MSDRWRRELKRLNDQRPEDELLTRAREGPRHDLDERKGPPTPLVVLVAFAVFAAGGVLAWRAFAPGASGPVRVSRTGYPSPPASGYYVLSPDRALPAAEEEFSAQVTALTNLPEGTLVSISTTNEGT